MNTSKVKHNLGRKAAIALVTLVAAASAVVGVSQLNQGAGDVGAGDIFANIWIDPNGGACTLNATPAVYSDAAACTPRAAEALFAPGRSAGLKGGSYAGLAWYINRNTALDNGACDPYGTWGAVNTADCMRIFVPSGETARDFNGLGTDSSNVWIDGERTSSWPTLSPTYNLQVKGPIGITSPPGSDVDHVSIDGVDATHLLVSGADRALIRNSDAGGRFVSGSIGSCTYTDEFGSSISNGAESKIGGYNGFNARNIVLDGIYFHDVDQPSGNCHEGALFVVSANPLTIRNSVWSQTWVYAIQIQDFEGIYGAADNVTIENNWFGCNLEPSSAVGNRTTCSPQAAIQFNSDGTPFTNYLVRFNSFASASAGCYAGACSYANSRFIGNAGRTPLGGTSQPCGAAGIIFDDNAWSGGTCSAGDTNVGAFSTIFSSLTVGNENLHLLAGSGANNLVVSTSGDYALLFDIDSEARSTPRDAGADELSGPPPPPPPAVQCADSLDNDGDGLIDLNDPGCESSADTDETNSPPPPPVDLDRTIFCSEFVPSIQGNSYYPKWATQNPGDANRWVPFRNALCAGQNPSPPSMLTLYGKALVAAGKTALDA